jgi:hypothetical protein
MNFPEADCDNVAAVDDNNVSPPEHQAASSPRQIAPAPKPGTSSPWDNSHASGGSDPSCWVFPDKYAPPGSTPGQYPHINQADYSK